MMNNSDGNGISQEPTMLLRGLEARDLYIRNISANLNATGELAVRLKNAIAELKIAISDAKASEAARIAGKVA
jgi:hypothetical protein